MHFRLLIIQVKQVSIIILHTCFEFNLYEKIFNLKTKSSIKLQFKNFNKLFPSLAVESIYISLRSFFF